MASRPLYRWKRGAVKARAAELGLGGVRW